MCAPYIVLDLALGGTKRVHIPTDVCVHKVCVQRHLQAGARRLVRVGDMLECAAQR